MLTKICRKCKIEQSISNFNKAKDGKYGVRGECKTCIKRYRIENKNNIDQQKKEYYNKNKETIIIRQIEYYNNHKFEAKEYKLLKNHGITIQKWLEMLEEQAYSCFLCKKFFDLNDNNDIHVDHNHQTNQIRKLLCNSCNNLLIGYERDVDVEEIVLRNSIEYLNKMDYEYKYYVGWKYKNIKKYKYLMLKCDNKCEICKLEFNKNNKKIFPCIDHNHETGMVRGILCNRCNLRLGYSKDDKIILEAAISYLK